MGVVDPSFLERDFIRFLTEVDSCFSFWTF